MRLFSLAILVSVMVLVTGCRMYYPAERVEYTIKPSSVSEGKRLTLMTCGPCHYNPATHDFSGKQMEDSPAVLGKIYASNITRHETGTGRYTDDQLAYLIRTGVSKDGRLMPYMKRPNMADEDLQAIITYLRSDDPLVKPSNRLPGKTRYSPLGKLAISMSKPVPYSNEIIVKPEQNKITLGKYLVDNLACYHCHSKSFASLNIESPEKSKGYMGGGNTMKDANGKKIKTPNLTFHTTGIGSWTEAEFKRAITQGISKDNSAITFPMPLYPQLNDEEVSSIYAYLKSVPPIDREVKRR